MAGKPLIYLVYSDLVEAVKGIGKKTWRSPGQDNGDKPRQEGCRTGKSSAVIYRAQICTSHMVCGHER